MRFKSRVRSFSSSCVKGLGWFVTCSALQLSFSLALLSVDEKHSISLISTVASGTGIPGHLVLILWLKEYQGLLYVFCSSDLFLK